MKVLTLLGKNLKIKINNGTIIYPEGKYLLVFVNVETEDSLNDVTFIKKRIIEIIENHVKIYNNDDNNVFVVVMPFAHLSEFSSSDKEHINWVLENLIEKLNDRIKTYIIATNDSKAIFSEMTLIDTIYTSKLKISNNSLGLFFRTLLRKFSFDTLYRELKNAQNN